MKKVRYTKGKCNAETIRYNKSTRGVTSKRRKKSKDVIVKPHKYSKLGRYNNTLLKNKSVINNNPLKDSTSETSISDRYLFNESNSFTSVSLDEQRFVDNGASEVSEVTKPINFFDEISESSEDIENEHYKKSFTNSFSELFEVTSSDEYNPYVGDISDIITGNLSEDSNALRSGLDEFVNVENINNISGIELNDDTTDLRQHDFITEENYEDTSSESSQPDYEVFQNDSNYIVVVKYLQKIKIFGCCGIKVLFGKINVLGYTLTSKSPEYQIYSPRGTALLVLKNTSIFCTEETKIKSILNKFANELSFKDIMIRKDSSIILFSKTHDCKMNFIEDHISQWILPKRTAHPCMVIEPKGSWNTVTIQEDWDQIVKNLTSSSRLFICGGKGVGKSTFLRYAVNSLLLRYEAVRVIDLDPGQAEFTVPGTLSILTITEPLLGVNYTHLKTTERSILCDITVSQDPHKYVRGVEEIMKFEKETQMNTIPTLINFMGYSNDIAFHLVSSTIAILQPNKIVYLESRNVKKNFKIKLTKEILSQHGKLFTPDLKINFDLEIIHLLSQTDQNKGWTLQPRQMREMCILAYFGQCMDESVNTLQNCNLPMYEVDLLNVSVIDKNNSTVQAEAINANAVALCILIDEQNLMFQCCGWGIVRAVDYSARTATIITPLNEDILNTVTHLVAGCLTLPPSIYMNYENIQGHVPYVMEGELIDFAQMSKRTHIAVNNKNN